MLAEHLGEVAAELFQGSLRQFPKEPYRANFINMWEKVWFDYLDI